MIRRLAGEGVAVRSVANAQPVPAWYRSRRIGGRQNIVRHKIGAARDAETGIDGATAIIGETGRHIGQINRIAIGVAAGQAASHHGKSEHWRGRDGMGESILDRKFVVVHIGIVEQKHVVAERPCVQAINVSGERRPGDGRARSMLRGPKRSQPGHIDGWYGRRLFD